MCFHFIVPMRRGIPMEKPPRQSHHRHRNAKEKAPAHVVGKPSRQDGRRKPPDEEEACSVDAESARSFLPGIAVSDEDQRTNQERTAGEPLKHAET